jgi:hypothetical protein
VNGDRYPSGNGKIDPVATAARPIDEGAESQPPPGGALYPSDAKAQASMLGTCLEWFHDCDEVRAPLAQRWRRFYKLYRSYVIRRKGDWRSKVFIPICFYIIEAIVPRLVAQLPAVTLEPMSEEDEEPAKIMEKVIGWATRKSRVEIELVKIYKSALKYGTGIGKVRHERRTKQVAQYEDELRTEMIPSQQPILDPDTGMPMRDLTGEIMGETIEFPMLEPTPTGRRIRTMTERVAYDGPICDFVNIFNFWPSPEATSVEDARYVIQRTFRDTGYIQKMLDEGIWRLPDGMSMADLSTGEQDELDRVASEIDEQGMPPAGDLGEVLEFWTDDAVMVVLNRAALVRADHNPYEHGEKPFVRFVDYIQEGEFWGVGEIEAIEGMQDITNALWNQRIDNVRLSLNRMYAFDPDNVHDLRDLQNRPGGLVRVRTRDIPAGQVVQPLDIPDVTASAYTEVAEIERMTEKVSGVSAYTTGTDSPTMNDTATGISLITEQGNTRFALKVKFAEMTGLTPLARMYGSILQQFMPDEMSVRLLNEDGNEVWETITAEAIQGGFDYIIEAESSTVTESVRKEQSMTLLQTFAQVIDPATGQPVVQLRPLAEDVLENFGKKNKERYFPPETPQMGMGMPEAPPGVTDPNQLLDMMAQGGGAPA